MTADDPSTIVAQHLARAERALQDTAGSRSMCAIARSGQSFPAAKYHEGASSALTQLRRHTGQRQAADLSHLARASARQWRDRAQGRLAASSDWRAYYTGGAEALDALAEQLDSNRSGDVTQGVDYTHGSDRK